jgi:hypothetical protein
LGRNTLYFAFQNYFCKIDSFTKIKKNQLLEVGKLLIKSGVVITVEMNKNPAWVREQR